nr:protein TPR1-like isoform X14 [Ipomoea batatas]
MAGHSDESQFDTSDDESEPSKYGEEGESIDGDEDVEEYESDAGHSSGSGGVSLLSSTAAGVQRSSSAVIDEQSSGYDLRILTICQLGGEKLGDSSNLLLDSAATSD